MQDLMIILLSAIFVENFVLSRFLGICPFIGVSKKIDSAIGMSLAVTFVMVMATVVTWPINEFILMKFEMDYMVTVVFILVIASLVQFVMIVLEKFFPILQKNLGVFLPLITTNCAVLGVTLLNLDNSFGYLQSIFNALGAGLGFMLAIVLFAGLRQRIDQSDVPKVFQGIPIALITAALMSLGFIGFQGVVEGIFS